MEREVMALRRTEFVTKFPRSPFSKGPVEDLNLSASSKGCMPSHISHFSTTQRNPRGTAFAYRQGKQIFTIHRRSLTDFSARSDRFLVHPFVSCSTKKSEPKGPNALAILRSDRKVNSFVSLYYGDMEGVYFRPQAAGGNFWSRSLRTYVLESRTQYSGRYAYAFWRRWIIQWLTW